MNDILLTIHANNSITLMKLLRGPNLAPKCIMCQNNKHIIPETIFGLPLTDDIHCYHDHIIFFLPL